MSRNVRTWAVVAPLSLALVFGVRPMSGSRADEPGGREIPPAFANFEYLVGQWTGQATPKDSAQSFRGWTETHSWAWIFMKGQPTGMSVAIQGGKILAEGKLSFDANRKRYRLEGTAPKPGGGPVAFEGALDARGKVLLLEQVGTEKGKAPDSKQGTIRLSIYPNSNFIRYTMSIDRKEPGGVQFARSTDVGLTRKGESLAGGSTSSDRPKCIVTGGAATMTLSYNGQTFPICCTGCRDEFNENPEKYIKKASLMAQSRGSEAKSGQPAPTRVSRFEDAFAGDVAEAPAMKTGGRSDKAPTTSTKTVKAKEVSGEPSDAAESGSATKNRSASRKNEPKTAASSPANRAASLLRIAQNLEKSGKTEAALKDYKRIVKDFAETPAAKTAKQRIRALEKP
jgi:YHS domain-containing protein